MPAPANELIGPVLGLARLIALGRHPPGCLGDTALALSSATAVGVVHRVHGHSAHHRTAALPAPRPCLAQLAVLVLRIGQHSDGGCAPRQD